MNTVPPALIGEKIKVITKDDLLDAFRAWFAAPASRDWSLEETVEERASICTEYLWEEL